MLRGAATCEGKLAWLVAAGWPTIVIGAHRPPPTAHHPPPTTHFEHTSPIAHCHPLQVQDANPAVIAGEVPRIHVPIGTLCLSAVSVRADSERPPIPIFLLKSQAAHMILRAESYQSLLWRAVIAKFKGP